MAKANDNSPTNKLVDSVTKDLPKLIKDNKGAAIGAVAGYLLNDLVTEHEGLLTTIVGALAGHIVDEKSKAKKVEE